MFIVNGDTSRTVEGERKCFTKIWWNSYFNYGSIPLVHLNHEQLIQI